MPIEVVLLKDVERLGRQGTVVRVSPGYARNYLMPSGLAAVATVQQLRQLEEITQQQQRKAARVKGRAETQKRNLESLSLTLKLNLGEGDKPFGSITTHDLLEALEREGIRVEKQAIHLEQPIKSLGIYEIPVRLHPEVTAAVKLWVVKA